MRRAAIDTRYAKMQKAMELLVVEASREFFDGVRGALAVLVHSGRIDRKTAYEVMRSLGSGFGTDAHYRRAMKVSYERMARRFPQMGQPHS